MCSRLNEEICRLLEFLKVKKSVMTNCQAKRRFYDLINYSILVFYLKTDELLCHKAICKQRSEESSKLEERYGLMHRYHCVHSNTIKFIYIFSRWIRPSLHIQLLHSNILTEYVLSSYILDVPTNRERGCRSIDTYMYVQISESLWKACMETRHSYAPRKYYLFMYTVHMYDMEYE